MTKQDFELIAETVRACFASESAPIGQDELAMRFAVTLERRNPRFDRARFLRACGSSEA